MAAKRLAPGSRLGAYRIVELLGQGGMGAVYKAEDERGGLVAIKLLLPELARNEMFAARFRREANAARAIAHEGVVAVRELGEEGGVPFLVLEDVPGGTLKRRIRQKGALPWPEAAWVGARIAGALAAIHAAGLVHRDLKPENVLIGDGGDASRIDTVKVSDFGLVGKDAAISKGSLTKTGELLGTLEYMAPEQADDAGRVDARADLYSLGATLYCMVTGDPPFSGTGVELVTQHLRRPPRPPRELVADLPRAFERLVLALLEKEPAARPASASAVADELDAIARPGGGDGSGRRTLVAAGVVATLVAVALAAGLALASREPSPGEGPEAGKGSVPPASTNHAPPPKPAVSRFPEVCQGFLRSGSGLATLAGVFGRYGGKASGYVGAVAFSPDGKLVLSGDVKHAVVLWDLEKGIEVRRFRGHEDSVNDVAFSPDGKLVLSSSNDRTLRAFDLESGRERGVARFDASVTGVAVAPGGKRLAAAIADGTIALLDLPSLKESSRLRGHEGEVSCVAFDRTGMRLLSGSYDRTLRVWDMEGGREIRKLDAGGRIVGVALSHDGTRALAAGLDKDPGAQTRLWDLASGDSVAAFEGGGGTFRAVAVSPDGKRGLLGAKGALRVLDLEQGRELARVRVPETVVSVAFSPDGHRAVTGENWCNVRLWDLASGSEVGADGRGAALDVKSVAFTPDGKRALGASLDGTVRVFDVASQRELARLDEIPGATNALAVAPDGQRVVTAHYRRCLAVWDLGTRQRLRTIEGAHGNNVLALALSPDGKRALSGADEGTVKLWDLESEKLVSRFEAGGVWVYATAISKDGKLGLFSGTNAALGTFELEGGRALARFSGHEGDVNAAVFLRDDRNVLSAGADKTLKLWEANGTLVRTFTGHTARVHRVAVFPGGERALSTGEDGTIRFWELATGRELDRIDLASSSDEPIGLALSSDARSLLVGTQRGMLLRFELEGSKR